MKTRVDERLRAEAAAYALKFACEDCAHFVARSSTCLHGYPAAPRRDALAADELAFCKDFDLTGDEAP